MIATLMATTVAKMATAVPTSIASMLAVTFDFELQYLLDGSVRGLTFAALAAGFVLIYRSTGVLNFAHAEVGAVGLAIFVYLLVQVNLNWWFAFALSLIAGAMISMIVELIVVERPQVAGLADALEIHTHHTLPGRFAGFQWEPSARPRRYTVT